MSTSPHIIGKSGHADALRRAFGLLARNRRPCMIIGEPGVGKSFFAAELGSLDADFHLIPVARLNEDELARQLQSCTSGTVVFDDLDRGSFRQQECILDFLTAHAQDVRIVVTFSARPADLHEQNKLIDALYGKVLEFESLEILPLRERPEDIPVFVRHFAPDLVIDINGLDALIRRLWQENVREIRTIVERCLTTASDGVFRLPSELVDEQPEIVRVVGDMLTRREHPLETSLDTMERGIIERTLARFGFDPAKSAEFLGMSREDFEEKAQRLGLAAARTR